MWECGVWSVVIGIVGGVGPHRQCNEFIHIVLLAVISVSPPL